MQPFLDWQKCRNRLRLKIVISWQTSTFQKLFSYMHTHVLFWVQFFGGVGFSRLVLPVMPHFFMTHEIVKTKVMHACLALRICNHSIFHGVKKKWMSLHQLSLFCSLCILLFVLLITHDCTLWFIFFYYLFFVFFLFMVDEHYIEPSHRCMPTRKVQLSAVRPASHRGGVGGFYPV